MRKTFIILLIASLTVLSITSCKKSAAVKEEDETPPNNTVYIYDNYFVPTSITVTNPNTEITWVNKGSSNHTVTSGTPSSTSDLSRALFEDFNSATLSPGMMFKHTFEWEGDWNYYCTFHPAMRAVIKVQF